MGPFQCVKSQFMIFQKVNREVQQIVFWHGTFAIYVVGMIYIALEMHTGIRNLELWMEIKKYPVNNLT